MTQADYRDWLETQPWYRPDINYPPEGARYLSDEALRMLLLMHGAKVSRDEVVQKAGVNWDGGPGMNKWYEALDHYLVTPEQRRDLLDQGLRDFGHGIPDDAA